MHRLFDVVAGLWLVLRKSGANVQRGNGVYQGRAAGADCGQALRDLAAGRMSAEAISAMPRSEGMVNYKLIGKVKLIFKTHLLFGGSLPPVSLC